MTARSLAGMPRVRSRIAWARSFSGSLPHTSAISFTFFIAGALAGSAALLYALYITNIRYNEGFRLGLIAFTAAVVGGIGNLPGAVLGGLVIAMIESFNNGLGWATPGSDWTQSIIFSVLIVVLVFRPEGLLGERTPEGG